MLNTHGRAAFWVPFILLAMCTTAAAGWYSVNNGWNGTLSGTWSRLTGHGDQVQESAILPFSEKSPTQSVAKPAFPSNSEDKSPAETTTPEAASEPSTAQNSSPEPSGESVSAPASVLKACVDKLKNDDVIGAEQFVSESGMHYSVGSTVGVHEVLWKGLYRIHAYDGIDYDRATLKGQTAWFPVYTSLGQNRMTTTYVILANRGDGWKVDHLCDTRKY